MQFILYIFPPPFFLFPIYIGLQTAFRRLRKHISDDSGLFLPLWDRLTMNLFGRYSRYEEIALRCYDYKLEPSAFLIRTMAQECRAQATQSK